MISQRPSSCESLRRTNRFKQRALQILLLPAIAAFSIVAGAEEFELGSFALTHGTGAAADPEFSIDIVIAQSTNPELGDDDFLLQGGFTGATFAVPLELGPRLRIEPDPEGVRISWVAADASWVLERSTQLSVPGWSALEQTPVQEGNEFSVTIPLAQTTQFFRLRQAAP